MYDKLDVGLRTYLEPEECTLLCEPCNVDPAKVFGVDPGEPPPIPCGKRPWAPEVSDTDPRPLRPANPDRIPGELPEVGAVLYKEGIRFDIPKQERRLYSDEMLNALKRLHINTGHAPNADVARLLRLSGCSPLAIKACRLLSCSTCAKMARPKISRPSRIPSAGITFNETVQLDPLDVMDTRGRRFLLLCCLDVTRPKSCGRPTSKVGFHGRGLRTIWLLTAREGWRPKSLPTNSVVRALRWRQLQLMHRGKRARLNGRVSSFSV